MQVIRCITYVRQSSYMVKFRWCSAPASEKQIRFLKNKKISVPDGLSKGEASRLIGLLSSRRS